MKLIMILKDKIFNQINHIILIVSILSFLIISIDLINIIIDDVYISARYSKNLVNYGELKYNPDGEAVEGFSNPLWTLTIAGVYLILNSFDINFWSSSLILIKIIAIFFGILTIILYYKLLISLFDDKFKINLSLLAFSTNYPLILNLSIGLETSQYLFLILLLLKLLNNDKIPNERNKLYIGFVLGLISISRPESILILFIFGFFMIYTKDKNYFISLLIGILIFGSYLVFRMVYYKDILPNTYYAKSDYDSLWGGLKYLFSGLGILISPYLIITLGKKAFLFKKVYYIIVGIIFVQIIFILYATGDWMPGFRFLVIIFPLLIILIFSFKEKITLYRLNFIPLILLFLISISLQRSYIKFTAPEFTSGLGTINLYEHEYVKIAEFINNFYSHSKSKKLIVNVEAGLIPFLVEHNFIDASNLNDRYLAKLKGKHFEKIDIDYIFNQRPDMVIIHLGKLSINPTNNKLLESEYLKNFYKELNTNFNYTKLFIKK